MAYPLTDTGMISLDTSEPEEPISLDTGRVVQDIATSPEVASSRAFKIQFGLGNSIPFGYQQIYDQLIGGQEETLRRFTASKMDADKASYLQDVVKTYAKQKQGQPMLPGEAEYVSSTIRKLNTPTDMNSVFEEAFAHKYINEPVNEQIQTVPSGLLGASEMSIKDIQDVARAKGSSIMAKQDFARTVLQDATDTLKKQGWIDYGIDILKTLTPGYTEVKLRGLLDGVSPFYGLLGDNLFEQSKELHKLPFEEFKEKYTAIMAKLMQDNPSVAVTFGMAVVGQSANERSLNNMFTLLVPTEIPFGGAAVRGLGRMAFQTNHAVKDLVKASLGQDISKSSMAEGIGDLRGAAAERIAERVMKEVAQSADPVQNVQESLLGILRTQRAAYEVNPGNLSREAYLRGLENFDTAERNLVNVIQNLQKVEQLPLSVAVQKASRAMLDDIGNDYPGMSILDGTLRKEKYTGTYWIDLIFGNKNAMAFKNEQVAYNFAHHHGLGKVTFQTYGDEFVGFETKGGRDTYQLVSDSTTVKARKFTPDKPQLGGEPTIKPESTKTVYVTPEDAAKLRFDGKGRIVDYNDQLSVIRQSKDIPYAPNSLQLQRGLGFATDLSRRNIDYSTVPQVGKVPVELFTKKELGAGIDSYVHNVIGDEITQLINIRKPVAEGVEIVQQQGGQFVIKRTVPLNHEKSSIRDYLTTAVESQTPKGPIATWTNALLGRFKNPDAVLSAEQAEARKAVTYGPSALNKAFYELGEDIRKLSKWAVPGTERRKYWNDFKDVIDSARLLMDPATGKRHRLFRDNVELNEYYMKQVGRSPSDQETAAYWAYKNMHETYNMLKQMNVFRTLSRMGAEEHRIYTLDGTGNRIQSVAFHGMRRGELPETSESVLLMGKSLGGEKVYTSGAIPPAIRTLIEEGVKSGRLKIIEMAEPGRKVLKGFTQNVGDARIRYVATENVETVPLSWNKLPKVTGGLISDNYSFTIKQARMTPEIVGKITKFWYEGDTHIMPMDIAAKGSKVAAHLDQVRKFIKDGKLTDAEAYSNTNLPIEWEEVHGWFKSSVSAEGIEQAPLLNLTEKIQLTARNKMIGDIDNELKNKFAAIDANYKDGTRKGFQERSDIFDREESMLYTITDKGSKESPLYSYEPTKFVDAMASLDRATASIAHSTFLDEYKIFSVERWIDQAGKSQLMNSTLNEMRQSPMWHFFNPSYKSGANAEKVAEMKAQHYHIQQLLGIPNESDSVLQRMTQVLTDSLYETRGGGSKLLTVPTWAISKMSDPAKALRIIGTHYKLGMFNIPQLWVQAQTYVNVLGIAGYKYALPGTKGSLLHHYARVNGSEAMLDKLDTMASSKWSHWFPGTSGYKPGEWKEAFKEAQATGFLNVGNEYAFIDSVIRNKTFQSGAERFLDAGLWFFREGERSARQAAWYTAYREFRDAVPTGAITDKQRMGILQRADLLTANMSRANNTMLHTGALSVPTQFYTYPLRMAELMAGKRITTQEKFRLLYTNALVYGVPVATGVTGLPFADMIRSAAIDHGYVVGDKYLSTFAMEGAPSFMLHMLTGNTYDVGYRFGNKGLEVLRDIYRGDKGILEVAGGISGSILKGTLERSDGFLSAMGSFIRRDEKAFEFTMQDVVDVFKDVSALSRTEQLFRAINTGKWFSRSERWVDDVTKGNAVFQYLSGLQNQGLADSHLMLSIMKNKDERDSFTLKQFTREYRRFLANHQDNPEQAKKYFNRAFIHLEMGDYPRNKIADAISLAIKGKESMLDSVKWDFYIRKARSDEVLDKFEAYKRHLQLKGN